MKEPLLIKIEPALEMVDLTSRLKIKPTLNSKEALDGEFKADLERALELEVGHSPPARKEREKLSALANSLDFLKEIRNFDAKVKKILQNNLEEVSSLAEEIGSLRHKVAQGDLSAKTAFAHLKELTESTQREKEALKEEELKLEAISKLKEESARLDEKALNHIPLLEKLNFADTDVWFNQIWPLHKPDSLFDHSFQIQIPYNPDNSPKDGSTSQEDASAWERQFESDWSKARKTSPDASKVQNLTAEGIRGYNPAMNGSEALPESDRIFSDLVQRAQMNLEQGNYQMNLELKPENLGNVFLKLSLIGDKMSARFLVDNEAVGILMASRLEELKASLAQYGVSPEKLEIAVRNSAFKASEMFGSKSEFRPLNTLEPFFEPQTVAYFQTPEASQSRAWIV
jgi:flagellar hook-length control protein FliK